MEKSTATSLVPVKKDEYQFVHSTYVKLKDESGDWTVGDCVVVNEKNVDTNESRLKFIKNPDRMFWIAKPGRRNYTEKLEYTRLADCDAYKCKNYQLADSVRKALNVKTFNQKYLFNSPYLYGADIDIATLVKIAYHNNVTRYPSKYKVSSFDIETSMLGGHEVIIASYMDPSNTVYISILKAFMKNDTLEDLQKVVHKRLGEFKMMLKPKHLNILNDPPFKVVYNIAEKELDLITWIFQKIHECKPDFVGVWNMGFDIPYVIGRIEYLGGDVRKIMCHPEVPDEYKYVKFIKDNRKKLEHFTDRWDWLDITGYTQFYDAMCLYSRLRKVKGREVSYGLDYVSRKILDVGKLDFGETIIHHIFQESRFLDYCAYNIVDSVLVYLDDRVTGDANNMVGIIGPSHLSILNEQTSQLRDAFYEYCRGVDCVTATVGSDMKKDYDYRITNVGGAVLDPLRTIHTGANILQEIDVETFLVKYASDIDAASLYPSLSITFNIARETKLLTCLEISRCLDRRHDAIMDDLIAEKKDEDVVRLTKSPGFKKYLRSYIGYKNKQYPKTEAMLEYEDNILVNVIPKSILMSDVNEFFSLAVAPDLNAVYLANRYLGLPDYQTIEKALGYTS